MDPIIQANPEQKQSPKFVLVGILLLAAVGLGGYIYMTPGTSKTVEQDGYTQKEAVEYVKTSATNAVAANSVNISGCAPDVKVAQVNMGDALEFNNPDRIGHTIWFSPDQTYLIPLQSKVSIKLNFLKFPGVVDYMCDSKFVGQVFITNK